jgi:hypothetical protein
MMVFLKIKITKYISNDFPGFIECSFTDAFNKQWKIIDKIPVLTTKNIDKNNNFPIEEKIEVEAEKESIDKNGNKLITININKPYGLKTINGENRFEVNINQIKKK